MAKQPDIRTNPPDFLWLISAGKQSSGAAVALLLHHVRTDFSDGIPDKNSQAQSPFFLLPSASMGTTGSDPLKQGLHISFHLSVDNAVIDVIK